MLIEREGKKFLVDGEAANEAQFIRHMKKVLPPETMAALIEGITSEGSFELSLDYQNAGAEVREAAIEALGAIINANNTISETVAKLSSKVGQLNQSASVLHSIIQREAK